MNPWLRTFVCNHRGSIGLGFRTLAERSAVVLAAGDGGTGDDDRSCFVVEVLSSIHLVLIDGRRKVERSTCCIERGEKKEKYAGSEAMVYEQKRDPGVGDDSQIFESVLSTYTPADSFLSERESTQYTRSHFLLA